MAFSSHLLFIPPLWAFNPLCQVPAVPAAGVSRAETQGVQEISFWARTSSDAAMGQCPAGLCLAQAG